MERIALVSDIHSNIHALEIFLNYIIMNARSPTY